jgi:hypothetical protein
VPGKISHKSSPEGTTQWEAWAAEPISNIALYQGTTSVVPLRAAGRGLLAPAALFPSQFGSSTREQGITFAAFNSP